MTERSESDVLKCRDVTELATGYMEGELSLRARLAMRLHLKLCSMCRAYLDQLAKTKRLLHISRPPPPADELEAQVIARTGPPQPPG
jgi:predicted anti-sigma-YlaC factor YlaD